MTEHFSQNKSGAIVTTNLDAVTSATDGAKIETRDFKTKSVFVAVSGNTGAVTVAIESSATGAFGGEEVALDTKTYTATNGTDIFPYSSHIPFMRVTTSTQSSSTVSAVLSGGN